jgi:hypothetical protein
MMIASAPHGPQAQFRKAGACPAADRGEMEKGSEEQKPANEPAKEKRSDDL